MEERLSDLEDRNLQITQVGEDNWELKRKRKERALWELSDSTRKSNIRIEGLPEGEKNEKGTESLFKQIIDEIFPNLQKQLDPGI